MALTTGLRRGELLASKWDHIDWNKRQYHVRETISMPRKKDGPLFGEPKTAESRNAVDLTPTLVGAFQELRHQQAGEKLKAGAEYRNFGLIFCQPNGMPFDPDNLVKRVFRPALVAAGIRSSLRFHDLRHTCAALLIAQGESPKYIQRQMRHASITTTLNVYGHLMPEVHHEAGERMDNVLFGASA